MFRRWRVGDVPGVARREAPARVIHRVGRRVAELRRAKDWTQERFAERLDTSVQWVSRVESGVVNLTIQTMCGLARALDVDVVELFTPPGPIPPRKPRSDARTPR